jgi:hypothetical protein
MNALEHFLNRATRGLRGQNRLEVREELEAHVLERANKHEVSGLARDAAIDQAVKELGRPETLALSFQDVHMLKQKQLFGAFAIMAVCAIAIWQATLLREFTFVCQSPDQAIQIQAQARISWLDRESMARDLERFSSNSYTYGEKVENVFVQDNSKTSSFYSHMKAQKAKLTLYGQINKKLTVNQFELIERGRGLSALGNDLRCNIQ